MSELKKKVECVVVAGMHRSGTSIVSKILVEYGVSMGSSFHEKQAANPDGFFEDLEFVAIHEEVLSEMGLSWDVTKPVALTEVLEEKLYAKYSNYVNTRSNVIWGVKDPRICLFIEQFHVNVSCPKYIFCQRNAEDVANSLMVRDGISEEKALKMKKIYDSAFETFMMKCAPDVLIVRYERLNTNPIDVCREIADFCGLDIDRMVLERASNSVLAGDKLRSRKRKQLGVEIYGVALKWFREPRYVSSRVIFAKLGRWYREIWALYLKSR